LCEKVSGQVSFLVQNLQGPSHYSCTIPAKNAIMLPISTGSCTSIEAHSTKSADLINCATIGDQHLTFKATLEDIPLNNLENNYTITKIFNMTVPDDNYELLKSGSYPTGAVGCFVFLKPPPTVDAGDHLIFLSLLLFYSIPVLLLARFFFCHVFRQKLTCSQYFRTFFHVLLCLSYPLRPCNIL
jgi:hypothetical protein